MTTGRINQVAFLNRRRHTWATPNRGSQRMRNRRSSWANSRLGNRLNQRPHYVPHPRELLGPINHSSTSFYAARMDNGPSMNGPPNTQFQHIILRGSNRMPGELHRMGHSITTRGEFNTRNSLFAINSICRWSQTMRTHQLPTVSYNERDPANLHESYAAHTLWRARQDPFQQALKLVESIAPTKQTNALHRSTRKTEEATARESFKGNINPN